MTTEKEKLRVELRSPPRIELIDAAELPLDPSNLNSRLALMVIASSVAFCCPVAVAIVWHVCTRRSRRPTSNGR
jgi:hypothetical protein